MSLEMRFHKYIRIAKRISSILNLDYYTEMIDLNEMKSKNISSYLLFKINREFFTNEIYLVYIKDKRIQKKDLLWSKLVYFDFDYKKAYNTITWNNLNDYTDNDYEYYIVSRADYFLIEYRKYEDEYLKSGFVSCACFNTNYDILVFQPEDKRINVNIASHFDKSYIKNYKDYKR